MSGATRHSSTEVIRERALSRALGLQRRAREAGWAYQFDKSRTMLATALRTLDSVPGERTPDLVAARIRTLVVRAYVEAEAGSADAGFAELNLASAALAELDPGALRDELAGLIAAAKGFMLIRAGHNDDGMAELDVAAGLLERGLRQGLGDPNVLAGIYLNRSLAYIEQARTSAAVTELKHCIALSDEFDLNPVGLKARHNLGYVAYMTGDMATALQYFDETATSCATRAPGMLAVVRLDQARALLAAGLAEDAALNLDDAIPGLRRQRASQDVAEAEVTRAAAALLGGELATARRWARSAERRFVKRGNPRWAAIAALAGLRAEASAALASGRVPAALPARAVKLADELRALMLEDETALALLLGVRLELRRGDAPAAAVLLDQVPRARATTPVDHRMLLRLCRAELAVAQRDSAAALREARAGLTELGRARDRMGGLELVCGTAIHGRELGELAVRLVLDAPRPDAARLFGWLERTRAQVYRYEPLPAIDDPVMAEKAVELRHLRRAVQLERLAGKPSEKLAKQAAGLEREVLRQGWYASPWGRPRPVATLAEVAAVLGDRALVTFAASGDELVAVVVVAGRARHVRLGSATAAAEWAARLHADIDALAPDTLPSAIVEVVRNSARRSAEALDELLIRPLWTLVGERELVVVPTGPLYAVPWGSLPVLHGRPVVVAPSATAWVSAMTDRRVAGRTVLARGPLLTGLVAEEKPLRVIYPDSIRLDGDQATVANVLSALDGAGLVHLAAHGEHEPTNAMFSRLELADGPLFAYELARLAQPPRHVVLAACELAMNYVRPGDEALGYAGALLASGVRTVIAAISRVGDESAATAMVDYHQRVAAGARPALALAESVAKDPYRRPFVCLGAG